MAARGHALLAALYASVAALRNKLLLSAGGTGSVPPMPVSPAGDTLLSMSLCNAEPTERAAYRTWGDMAAFEERFLRPIQEALAPVLRLAIESQARWK